MQNLTCRKRGLTRLWPMHADYGIQGLERFITDWLAAPALARLVGWREPGFCAYPWLDTTEQQWPWLRASGSWRIVSSVLANSRCRTAMTSFFIVSIIAARPWRNLESNIGSNS